MSKVVKIKQEIKLYLEKESVKNRIGMSIGDPKKRDKFIAAAYLMAIDDHLASCSTESIMTCCLEIADLGLPLVKSLGQAYILKYKNNAQTVIGYKGWLKLALDSGIKTKCRPVFKCDKFSFEVDGFDEIVRLTPDLDSRKEDSKSWIEDNLKGFWVVLKDNDNEVSNHFVSSEKLKQLSSSSPSKNSSHSPYSNWTIEMYQAKAIKYILSKTAMSEKIARAVEIDNQTSTLEPHKEEHKQESDLDLNSLANAETEDHDIIDSETGEIINN